jgi:hypothetical protein
MVTVSEGLELPDVIAFLGFGVPRSGVVLGSEVDPQDALVAQVKASEFVDVLDTHDRVGD